MNEVLLLKKFVEGLITARIGIRRVPSESIIAVQKEYGLLPICHWFLLSKYSRLSAMELGVDENAT